MAKHLVTGGSGFLGNLIAKRLRESGEEVTTLDIWEDPNRPKDIRFIHCDILNRDGVRDAMKGIDVVHHNVALVPLTKSGDKFWDVNVEGSRIAAEEAAKANVKSFINMSSSAIFGIPNVLPVSNQTPRNPFETYGKSKNEGEDIAEQICKDNQISFFSIRPRTILGQGRLGIFQILFDWIQCNKNIYIIGNGSNIYQFIHADDLVSAYFMALEAQKPGKYNVGCEVYRTLKEDLLDLILYAKSLSSIKSLPKKLTVTILKTLDFLKLSPLGPYHYNMYHQSFFFDLTPLKEIGWKPKYSNIDMFKESYDWFLANQDQLFASDAASPHRSKVKEGILKLVKKFA